MFVIAMSTRDKILQLGFDLIRDKGFNAFSFADISSALQLKNASVHYHFPSKADLGIAVIRENIARLDNLIAETAGHAPPAKLQAFFSIYNNAEQENKICLVGSLASDLRTLDEKMSAELMILTHKILKWVSQILTEGRSEGAFHYSGAARTKALMIITNMVAGLQVCKLTGVGDFNAIKNNILKELTT
jgi:TetR/AcrR family transcriptional regulator, transcriptional repressor for nem operon